MQNSKKQGNQKSYFREVYSILGLPFDALTQQQAIEAVVFSIENKQRCFLTTPNLNFLITAQRDAAFYQSVIDSDLNVADGMPIVWVAKLLGIPIKERVAGSDLFAGLSQLKGRDKKISVFFFGGQEGIAAKASAELNISSESMVCCGYHDPGFVSIDEMSSKAIIEKINQAKPDFLVVALGAAKGQEWIQQNKKQLNASVISHLGAVINFVAGHVERAPVFWQKLGLEWVWRIKQEPQLWKRYFFDGIHFIKLLSFNVLPLMLHQRLARSKSTSNFEIIIASNEAEEIRIKLLGRAVGQYSKKLESSFDDVLGDNSHKDICLDCTKLIDVDARAVSLLLLLQKSLCAQKRELYLKGVSTYVKYLLNLHNVIQRFQLIG